MKRHILAYGLLLLTVFVNADEKPATGPSGTVCESAGGSCKGLPDGVLIPYEGDCTQFIQCIDQCCCEKKCSAGLHFNKRLQVCDWPARAGCEPETGPCETKCESSGESCKNITDGTLIANSNDCTMYMECSMGCEINRNCPTGTHFSGKLKQCTWPSEAGCDSSNEHLQPNQTDQPTLSPKPTPSPSTTTTNTPGSKPTSTSKPNPSEKPTPSSEPTPTQNYKPTLSSKPTSSSEAGPTTSSTPVLCSVNCSTSSQPASSSREPTSAPFEKPTSSLKPSPSPEPLSTPKPSTSQPLQTSPKPTSAPGQSLCSGQESGTLLPFNGDCTKYIACGDGTAYIMDCGSELHFNAANQICDWPEQAGCDPSYVKPENNPSCQSKGASCIGEEDGKLLPYKYICEWFVACSNGCGFSMTCGRGLHFNKYLEVCDWPEDAGCDYFNKPNATEPTAATTDLPNCSTKSTTSTSSSIHSPCQTPTTGSTTTPSCSCS